MTAWNKLRRRLMTRSGADETQYRGFQLKGEQARDRLETVGSSFLHGFAAAGEADGPPEAASAVESTPAAYRGFAYPHDLGVSAEKRSVRPGGSGGIERGAGRSGSSGQRYERPGEPSAASSWSPATRRYGWRRNQPSWSRTSTAARGIGMRGRGASPGRRRCAEGC
ncbi:DUF1702 family protein [Micromonospora sp. DT178]|uniref:DUF1702 family protein n=1 Tax=Micromonospora sp. DT178 TaxID=3393436 RepID=UPI003CE908BA